MIPRIFRPIPQRAAGISFATLAAILLCTSCRTTPQAPPVHAAIPPAENLLPSDTLLLISVPDFSTLRAAGRQSPQWLFWNDPAMKPFHDKFMARWNEKFIAPLEHDLGVKLSDFTNLPQGQLTFAVTQNGWTGGDDPVPGVLLLLDAKDKSDLLKTNLTSLRKKWTDTGRPMHNETIRGISFSVMPLSSNDIPAVLAGVFPKHRPAQEPGGKTKTPPYGEIVVGQFESLLIVGSSMKAVEPVATRLTGGALPPLGDNPLFAADRLAQFRAAPLYYGWLNAKTLFDVLVHIPQPQPNPEAPSPTPQIPWDKVIGASGLTSLKTVSFSYRQSRDGALADFFISAPDTSREGIIKMITSVPKDANPPAFVPADAVKFWRWRVDGRKSWATLEKMLGNISPVALNSLNSFLDIANNAAQQQDPDFDVRKNIIGNLGDDWISYQKKAGGTTLADLNNAPSILIFAASNPDQTALAIKIAAKNILALAGSRENQSQTRDFLGRKIYTIPLPSGRTPGTNAVTSYSLYCASSGGYVALTTDVSMIEEYLRSASSKTKPLRETTGLADATRHVGGAGNGLFGYENQRELMRVIFTTLKNNPDTTLIGTGPLLGGLGKGIRDWLDFPLLPDYDRVSKYFYFTVCSGSVTTDGLSFEVFAPRPPQMTP
ncbi:MAG: hypothetical protein ABSD77_06510 [Verrucomicrobiota bacterium]|jgi:hypothetical protein